MAKAKFRIGDHVRYVGDIRKASWINETAIIADISNSGEYKVEWDRPGITNTGYGWGIRENSLEPVIDWSSPLELNDGTPVAVVGTPGDYHVEIRTLGWRSHPAFPAPGCRGSARLACGLVISNHKFYVRNRAMSNQLDPQRELRVVYHEDPTGRVVPFITETSEGHILVGTAPNGRSSWTIYDKHGNWVRSEDGAGSATRLINPPQTVERYVAFDNGVCFSPLRATPPHLGERAPVIKLTIVDGIVTSAALHRANTEPFNVD